MAEKDIWKRRNRERGVNNEINSTEKTPTLEKDLRRRLKGILEFRIGLMETWHSSWWNS